MESGRFLNYGYLRIAGDISVYQEAKWKEGILWRDYKPHTYLVDVVEQSAPHCQNDQDMILREKWEFDDLNKLKHEKDVIADSELLYTHSYKWIIINSVNKIKNEFFFLKNTFINLLNLE